MNRYDGSLLMRSNAANEIVEKFTGTPKYSSVVAMTTTFSLIFLITLC